MRSNVLRAFIKACAATGVLYLLVGAGSVTASTLNLGTAGNYNLFIFGNDTQFGSDVQGALAVGGDANFLANGSGFSLATSLASNTTNLVVGGNLTNQFNTLNGGAIVNGNVNWTGPSISGSLSVNGSANFPGGGGTLAGPVNVVGTYSAPNYFPPNANPPSVTPLPFSFATEKSYLQSASTAWAALTPNGSTNVAFGGITLTATGPQNSLYVFDVNGSDMSVANGLTINAPLGSTVLVNVDGTTDSMKNFGILLNGIDNQHVLYNFSAATNL